MHSPEADGRPIRQRVLVVARYRLAFGIEMLAVCENSMGRISVGIVADLDETTDEPDRVHVPAVRSATIANGFEGAASCQLGRDFAGRINLARTNGALGVKPTSR